MSITLTIRIKEIESMNEKLRKLNTPSLELQLYEYHLKKLRKLLNKSKLHNVLAHSNKNFTVVE